MGKVKVVFFDLDDTLLDTSKILIPIFGTPAFEARIKEALPLMPGARETLDQLAAKYLLFLITQGETRIQQQKIQSLGIESFDSRPAELDPARPRLASIHFR